MNRCPLGKKAMISLIKGGAFDEIETVLSNRKEIMIYYISQICGMKTKLNLQNFNGLIQLGLIPQELEMQIRIYNFTKYLKTYLKVGQYYQFNETCMQFFEKFMPNIIDQIETLNGVFCIKQNAWDKIYQSYMDEARNWIKENQEELLKQYNYIIFILAWKKYAEGSESHWEMDALAFYHGDHELKNIDINKYNLVDFNKLQSYEVDYYFKRKNIQIPIYKLYRIAGTVIAKNDNRHSITLLTTTGVVNVKFTSEYYAMFKKQISQIQSDGKKKVIEKSWFTRGTMLMVTGYRRDDQFIGKTYANTPTHQLYKITNVIGDEIKLQHERFSPSGALEEDYDEE